MSEGQMEELKDSEERSESIHHPVLVFLCDSWLEKDYDGRVI